MIRHWQVLGHTPGKMYEASKMLTFIMSNVQEGLTASCLDRYFTVSRSYDAFPFFSGL